MSRKQDAVQVKLGQTNLQRTTNMKRVSKNLNEMLRMMDYSIRKEYNTFTLLSLCGGDRTNFNVDKHFQKAFNSMSLSERVDLYSNTVKFIGAQQKNMENGISNNIEVDTKEFIFSIKIQKGFQSWENSQVKLQHYKIWVNDRETLDLRNYLLRNSKKKDIKCYVLQAICKSDPSQVRFTFLNISEEQRALPILRQNVQQGYEQTIVKMGLLESATLFNKEIKLVKRKSSRGSRKKSECIEQDEKPKDEVKEENGWDQEGKEKKSKYIKKEDIEKGKEETDRSKGSIKLGEYSKKKIQGKKLVLDIPNSINKGQSHESLNRSICEDILEDRQMEEELVDLVEKQNQKVEIANKPKEYKNIFAIMFPKVALPPLSKAHGLNIYQGKKARVSVWENSLTVYKLEMDVDGVTAETLLKGYYNLNNYRYWHPQVMEAQLKINIHSENTLILYQKHLPLNNWYRPRDYIYLRHLFRTDAFYVVDKSIENTNFVPFSSIERGSIVYAFCRIEARNASSYFELEISIEHKGMLTKAQNKELTLRYLQGFQKLQSYLRESHNAQKLPIQLDHAWIIRTDYAAEQHSMSMQSVKNIEFSRSESQYQKSIGIEEFYSIQDNESSLQNIQIESKNLSLNENKQLPKHQYLNLEKKTTEIVHEITSPKPVFNLNNTEEQIILDENGQTVLPCAYLRKAHPTMPLGKTKERLKLAYEHIMMKDDWSYYEGGGMHLTNDETRKRQDGVIKFVLKTLRNNLIKGKGILNISLPVDIFHTDSNIQRLCESLSLAPHFLEPAVNSDFMQRFKHVIAFALSNSVLYFYSMKPFNPILGETFQAHIDGCPVYAQQVSHHPPITAVYMVGRGYKIYASVQAKMDIGLNSGQGINFGYYHVLFDDGGKILFQTPSGELSGLNVGTRKYAIKGKMEVMDPTNRLFTEVRFQDSSGFFSGKKWKYTDQMEGTILKVVPGFIDKILDSKDKKVSKPKDNEIEKTFEEISGRWMFSLDIGGKSIYQINKDMPYKMRHYEYPLNSNSDYREDLIYRKKQDYGRSQIEKERLEEIQRRDRKLRAQNHPH